MTLLLLAVTEGAMVEPAELSAVAKVTVKGADVATADIAVAADMAGRRELGARTSVECMGLAANMSRAGSEWTSECSFVNLVATESATGGGGVVACTGGVDDLGDAVASEVPPASSPNDVDVARL